MLLSGQADFGPYSLCGWRVESQVWLPEVPAWDGSVPGGGRLRVELGRVAGQEQRRHFSTTAEGEVLLEVRGVARILVGRYTVTIDPAEGADPLLVRNLLYGSVLAVLCYQHGLLPLHGAGVSLHRGAVILSGSSGAGKSTLAAALAERGHRVLGDDVCAIDSSGAGGPLVWPAIRCVKLRAAAGETGRFRMAASGSGETGGEPVPVAAIYALDLADENVPGRTLLRGKDRIVYLNSQAHRGWMARALGLQQQLFGQLTALARAIPVYHLVRPRSLDALKEVAAFVETAQHDGVQAQCAGIR